MISVPTQRFGSIERSTEDVLTFPSGIFGFELNMRWLLMGDRRHGTLYWLQNVEDTDLSFPVVEPREFVKGYALEVNRSQLASIWSGTEQLTVLSVLTEYDRELCLNLRNPIIINPATGVGAQILSSNNQPLRYTLPAQSLTARKSA